MSKTLKSRTVSGLKWSSIEKFVTQGANVILTILLARFLNPEIFGLVAMVTFFSGFANIFTNMGFSNVIIFKRNLSSIDFSTLFWFNVLLGLVFGTLFFLSAGLLSDFYEEPDLTSIARPISLIFLLNSLVTVQKALLQKEMSYKRLAIIESASIMISIVIAVFLAMLNFGVWSLIFKILLIPFISAILLWVTTQWKPGFEFSFIKLRSHVAYGSNIFGNSMLTYSLRNVDNLIVGKLLGSAELGVYSRAYSLMMLPIQNFGGVIRQVMFTSFARIQDDLPRVKQIYLKVTWMFCFATFPLVIWLAVFSSEFVNLIFGNQWQVMSFPLKILSLAAIPQLILILNSSVYQALGKPHIPFRINLIWTPILIGGYFIGIYWNGLSGLVIVVFMTFLLGMYPLHYFAGKLIGLSFFSHMLNILDLIILSALQAIIGLLIIEFSGFDALIVLLGGFIVIFSISVFYICIFKRSMILEIKNMGLINRKRK